MFEQSDDLACCVFGKEPEQEVCVVLIESDRVDVNREPLLEPVECGEDELLHIGHKE